MGELASWRWDALRVADDGGEEALVEAAQMMFEHHGSLEQHDCPRKEFRVPGDGAGVVQGHEFYHNFRHAVAVLHVDFMLACRAASEGFNGFRRPRAEGRGSVPRRRPPRPPNDFEVKSSSELALRYNYRLS